MAMDGAVNVTPASAAGTPARWDPRAPAYASREGRVAALSSTECVFFAQGDATPHVMTLQVLQALDQCREFRALDDHAVRVEANVAGLAGQREAILRVLQNLVHRGLLLRDEDFLARLRGTPRREAPPLRAVCIRACDRPDRLAHLLASLAEYEQRFRARRRYVLIDDSVAPANRARHRELLRTFANATGCDVSCVGHAQAAKLAERIARACPQTRDAVRSLLLREPHAQSNRFGGGRSRNLALLLTAGARLVLLDDDLLLPLRRADFARDGFEPDPDATASVRFHANMSQALAAGSAVEEDPFEMHLDICGQPLGACTNGAYALRREALRGLNLGRLQLLDPEARIVTSQHGSYGSSRSESTLWLHHGIDRVGREELWQDRESYYRNSNAHFVFYGVSKARVVDVPGFTPFAFDNSELLPCTNPVGRAEDSLGSALTRFCWPRAVAFELPVAIGHVQESLRPRFPITHEASSPRVNDFLREFVKRQFGLSVAQEPGQRLAMLAHLMRDLARASERDRVDHLREYLNFVHTGVIDRLQRQLEESTDAPIYWQADARAIVQANAKRLLDAGAAPRLAEWHEAIDTAQCANALSGELDAMADACEHWPAIWRHSSEQGERLLAAMD